MDSKIYLKYLFALLLAQFFSGFSAGFVSQIAFDYSFSHEILLSKLSNAVIEGTLTFLLFFNFAKKVNRNRLTISISMYLLSLVLWFLLDRVLLDVYEPIIFTLVNSAAMLVITVLAVLIAKQKK